MYRKTDLAYLAGFYDGEGSIQIVHQKTKRNKNNFSLQIRLFNTNLKVLYYYWNIFKLGHIYQRKGTNKLIYTWVIYSNEAKTLLSHLLPYLIIKKKQVKIGIHFQNRIIKLNSRGKLLTNTEQKIREKMRLQISKLNIRSGGNNKVPVKF